MKIESGITLVALVVSIVVLIILTGISINLVLGDTGIITIAKKAKENTELAKIEEEKELNELYAQLETGEISSGGTDYDSIAKLMEFKRKIAQGITNEGVSTSEDAIAETMVENIGKILQVRTADATASAGNIAEGKTAYINGEKIVGTATNSLTMTSGYLSSTTKITGYKYVVAINQYNGSVYDPGPTITGGTKLYTLPFGATDPVRSVAAYVIQCTSTTLTLNYTYLTNGKYYAFK